MNHLTSSSRVLWRTHNLRFTLMMIGLFALLSCAGDDELVTSNTDFEGFGVNQISPNQSAVGALFSATGNTGCSVAFLASDLVITAARCVANQPAGPYFVIVESPASQNSVGFVVAEVIIHPLWNSIEEMRASEHVSAVRQGMPAYYQSNASYDLAILKLATPKNDGVTFEPNRSMAALQTVETLFFADAPTGVSRSGGQLTVAMSTLTTLTVTQYSLISATRGGGAAMITLDTNRAALIGIASGGDTQGIVFTQVSAHQAFISDVAQGLYSPTNDLSRYRVIVSGVGPSPDPLPNPQPQLKRSTFN